MAVDTPPPLPALCKRSTVQERLRMIFPEGTPNRIYCVREIAAATVFTMLKKTVSRLAWGSFAWFVSDPERIVVLQERATPALSLSDLLLISRP